MRALALIAALSLPAPLAAQDVVIGEGAVLRGLDKVTGDIEDKVLRNGEQAAFGRLTVTLAQCRYPEGNPSGDAFAYLEIRETRDDTLKFEGWMIASSPALNALDHPRHDVWVMRCTTAEGLSQTE